MECCLALVVAFFEGGFAQFNNYDLFQPRGSISFDCNQGGLDTNSTSRISSRKYHRRVFSFN